MEAATDFTDVNVADKRKSITARLLENLHSISTE